MIIKTLEQLGLTISIIVITHVHSDHIGALAAVKHYTGAPFAIHEEECSKAARSLSRVIGGLSSDNQNPDR
ncbi:MAG TPA: MBL fold metallo-hydrolase, partial [Dehalococcoidia bacterium]|nr:MBL fold metallo-hydrolase [Dehalococcoidia bacterium]